MHWGIPVLPFATKGRALSNQLLAGSQSRFDVLVATDVIARGVDFADVNLATR